jgi:glycosyltransferase involved in cell wall biosynthesis
VASFYQAKLEAEMNTVTRFYNYGSNVIKIVPMLNLRADRAIIVVPCYNEAERLDLHEFSAFLHSVPGVRFLFVNDGSRDATLSVLASLHEEHPDRVEIVSLSRNAGKAEAVRQGLAYAAASESTFVGYWDADLATPLDAIVDFLKVAERYDEVEVVYGARAQLLGHRVSRTLSRRMISRICARLARIAVGLPISDTQCGAKLLRNNPRLRQALIKPFSAGWLFDVELFSRLADTAASSTHAFYEYPLPEWTEVLGSKVTGRAIRRAGFAMLRLIAERRLGLPAKAVSSDLPQLSIVNRLAVTLKKAA